MSKMPLFIDDERFPPRDGREWFIARDWEDVAAYIKKYGMPPFVSFDHDLGDGKLTGYDIAKNMVEIDIDASMDNDHDMEFPDEFDYYVHSQNLIGKKNIEALLDNYLEFKKGST